MKTYVTCLYIGKTTFQPLPFSLLFKKFHLPKVNISMTFWKNNEEFGKYPLKLKILDSIPIETYNSATLLSLEEGPTMTLIHIFPNIVFSPFEEYGLLEFDITPFKLEFEFNKAVNTIAHWQMDLTECWRDSRRE